MVFGRTDGQPTVVVVEVVRGGYECERVMCNTILGFKVRQMTPADNGVVKTIKYVRTKRMRNIHIYYLNGIYDIK